MLSCARYTQRHRVSHTKYTRLFAENSRFWAQGACELQCADQCSQLVLEQAIKHTTQLRCCEVQSRLAQAFVVAQLSTVKNRLRWSSS